MQGLIQVYTGEGKGKTTAATGLMVRAVGQGMRVLLVRFLKPSEPASGETSVLKNLGIEILCSEEGILRRNIDQQKVQHAVQQTFAQALDRIATGAYDMVVFDEANNALHYGYLTEADVHRVIEQRPPYTELVFTGRYAPDFLKQQADLVSEIQKIKHPMDAGIAAREGIEY